MDFDEYQQKALATAIYPHPIVYPTLGLTEEAGEVADKVKKVIRDNQGLSEVRSTSVQDTTASARNNII